MNKHLFIALEGIDGSGKSTQTKILARKLSDIGCKVYTTFEPTDSPIGSMIRNILKGNTKADEHTIAALFAADRLDHLLNEDNGILAKLNHGYTVICDRFYLSSYAYHGTHVDMDWVINSNAMAARIRKPDLHIFIDVAPETSIQRIKRRNATELYETLDNLTNVRNKYLEAFDKMKDEHIVILDGNRSLEAIAGDIWRCVQAHLPAAD